MILKEYTYSAPLMGTELDVIFITEQEPLGLFAKLLEFGQGLEQQYSRFLPDSELSQLNQQGRLEVSEHFISLLNHAQALAKQTGGVFNPLLSPVHLGYRSDFKTTGNQFKNEAEAFNDDLSLMAVSGKTVQLGPNQTLDFGGFLKGYVVQIMSGMTHCLEGSIVNLGGEVYVAGRDLESDSFCISIDNPVEAQKEILVDLKNEALATSGVYKRTWGNQHHIVDGTTHNSSASDLVSASVISTDGAQADALATVAIVLGSEKAIKLLKDLGLRYVLIKKSGEVLQNL